jgi:glycolate oxidase
VTGKDKPSTPVMLPAAIATDRLLDLLGPEQVRTDPESRYLASMDNLRFSRLPAARIFPADESAIRTVLSLANEYSVPITTRGAGSATTGATSPLEDGWVLDLSAWKQVHIDPVARMAYVQPGLTLAELDAAAAEFGLFYPPDPGSREYATIGGTIATNAGGMRGAKYGVTRDYVLALEGFLGNGDFVRWGANLRKFAAGYNMRDLWIGSEGTLGIITGAVLRLIPRPAHRCTAIAVFASEAEALSASHGLLLAGKTPSALEFIDRLSMESAFAFWQRTDPQTLAALPDCLRHWQTNQEKPALLLIETDGPHQDAQAQMHAILDQIAPLSKGHFEATDPNTTAQLWKVRRSCSQAMFEWGPRKLNEDVVVPVDAQLELLRFVDGLRQSTGLATPTFGHVADGNFHVHIMFDDRKPETVEAARRALHSLMEKVIDLGGAISGEHGIGLAKSTFLHLQHGPAEIAAMKAVKHALDPAGILNPDKIWTACDTSAAPREAIRLPWDH